MFEFLKRLFKRKKPVKLGLALGSGGAKGFVHLGALQAFEEEGVVFQYVAGTSIGSIIGALYAEKKYTAGELKKLSDINYGDLLTLPPLNMSMERVKKSLSELIGDKNFSDLQLPFKTVATDFDNGEKVVLKDGSLIDALCASSCFPPYFKPYNYLGKRLVDGAFTDAIPADLVKEMGADVIVAIDLSKYKRQPSKIEEMFKIKPIPNLPKDPKKDGYVNANIMIAPDLSKYSSIDFIHAEEMFDIGYESAKKAIPEIKKAIGK